MLFYVCFSFENILRIESDKVNNKNVSYRPSLPQKAVGLGFSNEILGHRFAALCEHF